MQFILQSVYYFIALCKHICYTLLIGGGSNDKYRNR
nr:MAG TPA: Protein of unknown function (DUF1378) [Caudoviricetes sp.]